MRVFNEERSLIIADALKRQQMSMSMIIIALVVKLIIFHFQIVPSANAIIGVNPDHKKALAIAAGQS